MIYELILPKDGSCEWAGMNDYWIKTPDLKNVLEIKYVSEPPHGDSYHSAKINGRPLPGYVWGCLFSSSVDSRYIACSWMAQRIERKTLVIDCKEMRYFVLPAYIYTPTIKWPLIGSSEKEPAEPTYEFTGNEKWLSC